MDRGEEAFIQCSIVRKYYLTLVSPMLFMICVFERWLILMTIQRSSNWTVESLKSKFDLEALWPLAPQQSKAYHDSIKRENIIMSKASICIPNTDACAMRIGSVDLPKKTRR